MQEIVSIIQSVGFPIVACYFMFTYMQKQETNHKEEVKSLTEVVENLRVTVASLQQLLEDKL